MDYCANAIMYLGWMAEARNGSHFAGVSAKLTD
jgi:hypothetical protein